MLSEYVLDSQKYHNADQNITWKQSSLRSWLNGLSADENLLGQDYTIGGFKSLAFTLDEIKHIKLVENKNLDNEKHHTPGGENSEDLIFCLSIEEYKKYIKNDGYVSTVPTRYAKNKKGLNVHPDNCTGADCTCTWWLRSPGFNSKGAAIVNFVGSIDEDTYTIDNRAVGVRPALWLKRSE
jgi:hypothetical protein